MESNSSSGMNRREIIQAAPAAAAAFAVAGEVLFESGAARAQQIDPLRGHFHPKGKAPSKYTMEVLRQAKTGLPFADTGTSRSRPRGLIAPMTEMQIKADAGHVAWDMERFQFLDQQEEFDSIHPSLQRIVEAQQQLRALRGDPGIYQVRGFDLAGITFVRGKTGWIVFDPLVSAETVRAAWKLFQEHVGKGLPVSAVIYSHTHGDHWGGVRGVVDEADVRAGKVPVIAPVGLHGHSRSPRMSMPATR